MSTVASDYNDVFGNRTVSVRACRLITIKCRFERAKRPRFFEDGFPAATAVAVKACSGEGGRG